MEGIKARIHYVGLKSKAVSRKRLWVTGPRPLRELTRFDRLRSVDTFSLHEFMRHSRQCETSAAALLACPVWQLQQTNQRVVTHHVAAMDTCQPFGEHCDLRRTLRC